jgi:hypothetical protein
LRVPYFGGMYPRSRRAAPVRRRSLVWLAALIVPALATSACSTSFRSTDAPASPTPTASTSKAKVDLSRLPVPRTEFCDVLSKRDVGSALDGPVEKTAHYGNGDEFEVRPGYRDVSHEYGCVFESTDGATAKVWVFARPVTTKEARTLVRRERGRRGCAFPDSVGFGSPGLTSVCRIRGAETSDPAVRARLEGLFRDSWMACEVSEPAQRGSRSDVLQRAETWCTGVVTTVAARP